MDAGSALNDMHRDHRMSCKEKIKKETCLLTEITTYDSGQRAVVGLPRSLIIRARC